MSFVIFAGCKFFGLMLGDMRTIDRNYNIVSNNSHKIHRVNNNLVIAHSGYTGLTFPIIEEIISGENKQVLLFNECSNILEINSHRIEKSYKSFCKTEKINSAIGLMGIDNKFISFLFISFIDGKISITQKCFKETDDCSICFLGNGMYGRLNNLFYDEFYKHPVFSIDNLVTVYKKVLLDESKRDISINNKFIMETI